MAAQHHMGSFRPTSLKRVIAFMAISLAAHVVLVAATSVGYLMRGDAEEVTNDAPTAVDAAADASPEAASRIPAEASSEPSSELPQPTAAKDATDAYMEAQPGGKLEQGDSLELFE